MRDIDCSDKLLVILNSMYQHINSSIVDDKSKIVDYEKLSGFILFYSNLKSIYGCHKKKGIELDKCISEKTGLDLKFTNYSYLRSFRNLLCHFCEDENYIDLDLSKIDLKSIKLNQNDFYLLFRVLRAVKEMMNCAGKIQ